MARRQVLAEDDIKRIHGESARPARDGDEAFRIPWELRSFALGVAYYESDNFPWTDFQTALVGAIDSADEQNQPEHYYARWVEALEALLRERGGIDAEELDRRTQQILETPRDETHQHPHDDPVAVDHSDDHGHDHS